MFSKFVVAFAVGILMFNATAHGQSKSPPAVADHKHASHGPHGGELLEVGKDEYHIELIVEDDKKQIVVFLLDKEAKSWVEIDSPHLAINAVIKGKPTQVKLKPAPQKQDKKGYSSCFAVVSPDLIEALHDHKSAPKLALRIQDKSYSVKIEHKHDHSDHQHNGSHRAAEHKNSKPNKR